MVARPWRQEKDTTRVLCPKCRCGHSPDDCPPYGDREPAGMRCRCCKAHFVVHAEMQRLHITTLAGKDGHGG